MSRLSLLLNDLRMKLLILSDLHLEFGAFAIAPEAEFDAVLLAGDIFHGDKALRWAAGDAVFGSTKPIIFVPGNHEYYRGQMQGVNSQLREAMTTTPNVHVLAPGELRLDAGRLRVLGCTLWTDYRAPVRRGGSEVSSPAVAMEVASARLNDHRAIRIMTPSGTERPLSPEDVLGLHVCERQWLLSKLAERFDGRTVVVTHHAPSIGSVAGEFASDLLTPAFVSDLPAEFFEVPALWIHGHTHTSFDYFHGKTRVVCNPRGYRFPDGTFENSQFDPAFIIDM